MLLYVYQLRNSGQLMLRREIERHAPVQGRLVYRKRPGYFNGIVVNECNLYDREAKDVLPPLVDARIARVNVGMLIHGLETHGGGRADGEPVRYRQSWVCAATEAEAATLITRVKQPPSPTGFDPADDDLAY